MTQTPLLQGSVEASTTIVAFVLSLRKGRADYPVVAGERQIRREDKKTTTEHKAKNKGNIKKRRKG